MAATEIYGYRSGVSVVRMVKVANTAAVVKGDQLKQDGAGDQYFTPISAGDIAICVALESCAIPAADGDVSIPAEFSPMAIFEYPPDAGTVTEALIGNTMDSGGAQSINIDASTDDNIYCEGVDTAKNTLFVSFNFRAAYGGIA